MVRIKFIRKPSVILIPGSGKQVWIHSLCYNHDESNVRGECMKKLIGILFVFSLLLTGCSNKKEAIKLDRLAEQLAIEFELEIETMEESILNRKGLYTEKVILNDKDGNQIINLELFDNSIDLENRIEYIETIYEKTQQSLYVNLASHTGGEENSELLEILFGSFLTGEKIIRHGNFISRYQHDNFKEIDDFILKYTTDYSLEFSNKKDDHYNVADYVEENFSEDKVLNMFDSIYETLIEDDNLNDVVITLKSQSASEIVEWYETNILSDLLYAIPYLTNKYENDDNFESLRNLYSASKIIREEEVAKEEAAKREQELAKKENNEKIAAEEYVAKLKREYKINFGEMSEFSVEIKHDEKIIYIFQKYVSEDLKTAVTYNITAGMFKEEMKISVDSLKSLIKTQNSANPTTYTISFSVLNPANTNNVIYSNVGGVEILNLFITE